MPSKKSPRKKNSASQGKKPDRPKLEGIRVLGKIELPGEKRSKSKNEKSSDENTSDQKLIRAKASKLSGLKVVDRIELPQSEYTLFDMGRITSPLEELSLLLDPGDAPPELIAGILADLSILYQLQEGGSGISFELKSVGKLKFALANE